MRALLLPLAAVPLALAFAACSTAPAVPDEGGPYAGIPSASGEGPVAVAQPVVPTGDSDLDAFLGDLAAAIDRHDWLAVARAMEPEGWGEQRALVEAEASGANGAPQVIAETLGIRDLARGGWEGLEAIRVVTLREVAAQTPGVAGGEGAYLVSGDVRLASGDTLPVRFRVAQRGGALAILVPLG